ncbi:hypothetical protein [Novosphingobium sp. ST904]|nr:hypothetical protein [Novosphingobium sp. ST904]TCM27200.1 hypothetical protein EDF59_13257 [Novosphingobium sp. ST904]
MLRLVLFSSFALVLATRKVHRSSIDLDRDSLKGPFYAQCYAISPFALLFSGGVSTAGHSHPYVQVAGVFALLSGFLFYGVVQIRWFRQELDQSFLRSFTDASIGIIVSVAITLGISALFR